MAYYLDGKRITAVKRTKLPVTGQTRTGYGPKISTDLMILLDGRRWHRVYAMVYSNSGTCYIVETKKLHPTIGVEAEQAIEALEANLKLELERAARFRLEG